MKKFVMSLFFFCLTISVFAGVRQKTVKNVQRYPKAKPPVLEPTISKFYGPNHRSGPITTYPDRDSGWMSTKIDSSFNGYGAYIATVNPLAYVLDEGYVAVYRQFQGYNTTAGYIGASQSEDGEMWFPAQKLNTKYPSGQEEPSLPAGQGLPQGRYPSAGFAIDGEPTAIWNEYTNATHGGGTYGGYPLYSFDTEGIGEFSNFDQTYAMNNGCATTPCDPPDLWNGVVQVLNTPDGVKSLAVYNDWTNDIRDDYYMIQSNNHFSGFFLMDDPYLILNKAEVDDEDNRLFSDGYTSGPDFHIDEASGIGYMVQTAYSEDYETALAGDSNIPANHTLYFKYTEDWGETWTVDGGYKNSGYSFISDAVNKRISDSLYTMWTENTSDYPDQLWYPGADCDTVASDGSDSTYECGDSVYYSDVDGPLVLTPGLFMFYDFDVRTDYNGGLHFVTNAVPQVCLDTLGGCDDNSGNGMPDSLYNWPYRSAGHYYFYNPNPMEQPNNWTLTFLNDYNDTYNADWDESLIPHLSAADYGPWTYFYPSITFSGEDESQVMWYAASEGPDGSFSYNADSSSYLPSDVDIFMSKSTDLGRTWTELENVTNTPGTIFPNKQVEAGVHLATTGTDDEVGVFYQMPDFFSPMYTPPDGYEDYKNRLYVAIYSNDAESGMVGLDNDKLSPERFSLNQNYPNPFNPITQISYEIPIQSDITLDLFDIRGVKVKSLINGVKSAGSHIYKLDASNMASGVYFYTLTLDNLSQTRKLVLMK
jgi:hypothetical protein